MACWILIQLGGIPNDSDNSVKELHRHLLTKNISPIYLAHPLSTSALIPILLLNPLIPHEVYHMRGYDDIDEAVELLNRAIDAACPADAGLMEIYEEYCQMKQYEESEEYWFNGEKDELERQWADSDLQIAK